MPDAVYDDLVVKGQGKPGADEVAESTWIRQKSIRERDAVLHFPPVLGAGEREAIVLAEEQHATLLTDDQRAGRSRKNADLKSLVCSGYSARPSDADLCRPPVRS